MWIFIQSSVNNRDLNLYSHDLENIDRETDENNYVANENIVDWVKHCNKP